VVAQVILVSSQSCLGSDMHSPRVITSVVLALSVAGVTPLAGCAPAGGGTGTVVRSWSQTSLPRSCDSARPINDPFYHDRWVAGLGPPDWTPTS
jgi:hypothetical protein